jgi:ribonuclease HI
MVGYNLNMLKENALNIYTDGSMLPSPRAGGIGIVFAVINDAGDVEIIKDRDRPGYKGATNNQMELEACISA